MNQVLRKPTCSWEGRRHSDMLVGRQTTFRHARGKADNILLPQMQKSREALADDAKVFERESETNNEHTAAVLWQRHDFIR